MRFDSRSAKAVGRVDILVNNACLPKVASRAPWHKDRPVAGRAAAMLAFAAGLLVGALGARAEDAPVGPQPTAERAGADSRRMRNSSRRLINPTSAPATPDTSTSSTTISSVRCRRIRRIPAQATALGQHQTMTPPGASGAG
jgi:hypothetical protein